jgi:hypothetical protein
MKRLIMLLVAAAAVAAVGIGVARAQGGQPTVKVLGDVKTKTNRFLAITLRYSQDSYTVKSGATLRFEKSERPFAADEPHTLTVVAPSDLPRTTAQVFSCRFCQVIGKRHQATKPPRMRLNRGPEGLNQRGDSLLITPRHPSITTRVSARAGTTLHVMCVIHPWMQATIHVT